MGCFSRSPRENILGLDIGEKLTHFPQEEERLLFPYHKMKVTHINEHRESNKFSGRGKVILQCVWNPALIENQTIDAKSPRRDRKLVTYAQPEEEKEPEH